ncbi:MAG: carboxypeptidase regulatory-like domain-containing protein, partial [bacterium]|nr:carboxypeptidase regulatory-like domain-containing protein [bacterium]
MNKKNRCECRGIPRIWLFSLLLLTGLYFHMEVEAQLMSITGKVMQKETGKGVARVELLLGEVNTGDYYFSKTDRNGNFRVRKVPHGIYQISEAYINATCPEALLVSEIPDIVEVLPGKNIGGLKIYLKRGAVISGYIFAADGVTPLKGVEVSADPRRYGKTWNVYTDARGKYVINGLDSGFKILYASINGSALESTNLDVKPHDNFDNVNFNLGRGTVTVKGKVVSDKDNTAIENAIVFLTHRDINDNYSAGFATTDGNGEYSLDGLKFPGTFELSVVHDEFEVDGTYVLLEKGDNNLNLQLSPQDEIATIRMANDNN